MFFGKHVCRLDCSFRVHLMIDTDVLDIVFMCALKSYMNTFLDIFDLLLYIDIMDRRNGTFEMICKY